MSRIDEMILDLCPNGVEHKALGDVGTVVRGKRFVKDDMVQSGIPCIHYGEIYTKYGTSASKSFSFVSEERASTLRFAQPGDVIIASAGETVEDIGKSVAWLGDSPIAIHDACYAFSGSMDPKFVSYFFASRAFRDQIRQNVSSSKISSISTQNIAKARIPVPPLQVQQEIVRILDQFANLEVELKAQLEAELEARRRQYATYLNQLLTCSRTEEVRRIPMGELGEFIRGNGMLKSDLIDEGVPAIHYGQIHSYYGTYASESKSYVTPAFGTKLRKAQPGNLVIATTSEDDEAVGKAVAWIGDKAVAVSGDAYIYRHSLDPKYVAYFFRTDDFQQQKKRSITGTKVRRVSGDALAKLVIPVPEHSEQERISSILDKFESLINDLSIEIQDELAARRKQYEYFRNHLLTFNEATA